MGSRDGMAALSSPHDAAYGFAPDGGALTHERGHDAHRVHGAMARRMLSVLADDAQSLTAAVSE